MNFTFYNPQSVLYVHNLAVNIIKGSFISLRQETAFKNVIFVQWSSHKRREYAVKYFKSRKMEEENVCSNGALLDINEWQNYKYDAISCLNLLDRCENPITLLSQIKNSLKPDGHLIIAIVLPYHAYVESGQANHKPYQFLPLSGDTFEQQVNSMIKDVIQPAGFAVEHWTRLPYLCEGDLNQSFYWLSDAVFILRHST